MSGLSSWVVELGGRDVVQLCGGGAGGGAGVRPCFRQVGDVIRSGHPGEEPAPAVQVGHARRVSKVWGLFVVRGR